MKTLISLLATFILLPFANAQSFTELAFQACKPTIDTCESFEKIKPCQETFARLLKGSPQDSLMMYYLMLANTKLAYLTPATDKLAANMFLSEIKPVYLKLDSANHFGIESKILWMFATCTALKLKVGEVDEETNLEKEINELYLMNKQNPRANLLCAFYNFQFKRNQRAKLIEQQLKKSLELFKREEVLKPTIHWGKSLANQLSRQLKVNKIK